MRFSNRAAFGWIETPAPISLRTSACSNTVTSRPRARSASAAVRPPIPPPTIAMRSEPDISFRPFLCALRTARGYRLAAIIPAIRHTCFSPCSCANFRRAGEILDHHLTHRKLLDLAGHSGREALYEPDVAGDLVMRDPILAKLANPLFVQGGIRLCNDPRTEFFAVLGVRNAEHL